MMLLGLLLVTAPLQEPAPDAPPKPKPVREKVVCKAETKTGSRVNFRQVCHTESEWATIRSETRRAVEKGQANRGRFED